MQFVIVLLIAAAVFGVCYLVDKGFSKAFRGKAQHRSGMAVRANKRFGVFGVVYSFFLAWASGATGLTLMSLLYAPGILMYIKGKKERGEPYLRSTLDKVVVFIILAAAVASIVLVVTGQVVL